jgi:hypothetical protein
MSYKQSPSTMYLNVDCISPNILCTILGISIEELEDCQRQSDFYEDFELEDLNTYKLTLAVYLKKQSLKDKCFLNYKNWFLETDGVNIELSYYITKYFAKIAEDKNYKEAKSFYDNFSYSIERHIEKMVELKNEQILLYLGLLDNQKLHQIMNKAVSRIK